MRRTIELTQTTLHYDEAFLSSAAADALFAHLRESVDWKQEFSRGRPFPRRVGWYADAGLIYRYSGIEHRGEGWPESLVALKRRIEEASNETFNSVLLNLYRDGRDSMGYHSDNEPELGPDPIIASLSLGAERNFALKHLETGERTNLPLTHGSLLVMGTGCQIHWRHMVPKTARPVGERINLTFRRIV
ncbi:MAG: alpha-ketoglutarate-dependent dioxygenase AlkB [Gemmataceae bacterium]